MFLLIKKESIALTRNSDFSTAVLRDVINIIEGPSKKKESLYVTVALSELHEIMRTAKHSLNKGGYIVVTILKVCSLT